MSSLRSFAAPHQRAAPTSSPETTEERDTDHKKRSGPKKAKASPNISRRVDDKKHMIWESAHRYWLFFFLHPKKVLL
uniref:Uncharacterized protein n=1 Tax=Oryza meridionalis TaxID=40149 RepID=A0A0E0ECV5_9ORYZ